VTQQAELLLPMLPKNKDEDKGDKIKHNIDSMDSEAD